MARREKEGAEEEGEKLTAVLKKKRGWRANKTERKSRKKSPLTADQDIVQTREASFMGGGGESIRRG